MNSFFTPINLSLYNYQPEKKFISYPESTADPLVQAAVSDLQQYLLTQNDWIHNFGLLPDLNSPVIGKMFGVLVVENSEAKLGYIAAFSGKLAGSNQHSRFVPPVFDTLTESSFVTAGMLHLKNINSEIEKLELDLTGNNSPEVDFLKEERKDHSVILQNAIFDKYTFINADGMIKDLRSIFHEAGYKNPPSGAGECAAPKLLHFAMQNNLRPVALAEFWWGLSPKSQTWKHGACYPVCKEKCERILEFVLS